MPDPHPHQVLLVTLLADQVSATADVLMQQEARDILRGPEGKIQPEFRILRDNPGNREDCLV
jgi:hypothetical protein